MAEKAQDTGGRHSSCDQSAVRCVVSLVAHQPLDKAGTPPVLDMGQYLPASQTSSTDGSSDDSSRADDGIKCLIQRLEQPTHHGDRL